VVWYDPPSAGRAERLLVRSAAVFEVLRYLGGAWRIGLVARAVPRPLLDAVYRLVARWRRRLFPPRAACAVAPASERERFLD
jgi:predicted DCC family thiol-disulfide oxidoreductase YuxK